MSENRLDSPVLIGGAGSSGSTLFRAILNRHPEIACGPEMVFFDKKVIYGDYETFRRMLPLWLTTGVPCDGYFRYPALLIARPAYGLTRDLLIDWSRQARCLREFVDLLQSHILRQSGKRIFAEKTPTNAYCFREFIELYPKGRLIHVIRDGRDVFCSLRRRGFRPFQAASRWLYDVSAALACRSLPQYFELRYEELVTRPEGVVARACEHIGVEFTPAMLQPDTDAAREKLRSWTSSATHSPINPSSAGRYKKELTPRQLARFYGVALNAVGAARLGAPEWTTRELLAELGYSVPPEGQGSLPAVRLLDPLLDWLRRAFYCVRRKQRILPLLTCVRRSG